MAASRLDGCVQICQSWEAGVSKLDGMSRFVSHSNTSMISGYTLYWPAALELYLISCNGPWSKGKGILNCTPSPCHLCSSLTIAFLYLASRGWQGARRGIQKINVGELLNHQKMFFFFCLFFLSFFFHSIVSTLRRKKGLGHKMGKDFFLFWVRVEGGTVSVQVPNKME